MKRLLALGFLAVVLAAPVLAERPPATRPTSRPAVAPAAPATKSVARSVDSDESATKYLTPTPEEIETAMAEARQRAGEVGKKLNLQLRELQTDHFLLFTDWPAEDERPLKLNLETANAAVSKVFDIPAKENVFVGKLPVFMFAKKEDFVRFAAEYDGNASAANLGGYYHNVSTGQGHLVMFKPERKSLEAAKQRWAYVLAHEFTHAFVHRYRTNVRIPKWLNEGLAEVVATQQVPHGAKGDLVARAKKEAAKRETLDDLFAVRKGFLDADSYPVCQTLVETLLSKNRKAFIPYIESLKDGVDPEEALAKHFGWNYAELEDAWRLNLKRSH